MGHDGEFWLNENCFFTSNPVYISEDSIEANADEILLYKRFLLEKKIEDYC